MAKDVAIGGLAAATGVKVPTIRYYESVGLLPKPPRTESNRRLYGDDAVRRLRFIRHARELGFEVDDIRQLLDLTDQPDRPCQEVDAIAQRHLAEIESRIRRLNALKREVARMIKECAKGSVSECRIIDVLAHHEHCMHDRH
jgi:DNA-binding transcriptional MerR regulator